MSLEAAAERTQSVARAGLPRWLADPLAVALSRKSVELVAMVAASLFFAYAFMAAQAVAEGKQAYQFGDFFALWTSAVLTHGGEAAINYDADALHVHQVALGMSEKGFNPFPYPPSLLLLLGPLGGLSLRAAFWSFMLPSFALFCLSMVWGRWRDWPYALGALIAPATAIALISGQTGFLSGALMVAGLRLLPTRPALAGVMFGLLTYKPQLGVLVPIALLACGAWRAIGAAALTFLATVVASGLVYGFDLWRLWAHSLGEYATRFPPVLGYMPTIHANAMLLGAPAPVAWALQLAVTLAVAVVVWRAFACGANARAAALLVIATFLATPHAFNYDMPMTTLALVWYLTERHRSERPLDLGEVVTLLLAFTLPFLMFEAKKIDLAFSFAPLGLMFCLIAWPRERQEQAEGAAAVSPP
jgi:hypothetical protein